jgi:hypothetical protein
MKKNLLATLLTLLIIPISACGSDNDSTGNACGGLEGLQCAKDQYCQFPIGTCGAADQTGTCELKPEVCAQIYSPVCGCDDKTYGNDCEAAGAGVSIVSQGECLSK